jgi:HlyD family secretion protein
MSSASASPVAPAARVAPKKKKFRTVVWMSVAALAVAVIGGMAWSKSRQSGKGLGVTTEKAVVRTITQIVTATGKIQPEIEVKISPEDYGEIIALPFRDGARVRKGDLIVRLKPDLYQAQVDQQTAAVSSARAEAISSQAKLEKAEADLKRNRDLFQRNLISESDYVGFKTAYDGAKADVNAALANEKGAEGYLNQAKDSLSKTVIYSPMDGTVSSLSSEVGERVVATGEFAGTEIMRVADLTNMEVRVKVNENDIPNVKVGDHALISIDAYPDRKFNGYIKEIGSSADNSGGSGSGTSSQSAGGVSDEVTNYLVKIRVADRDVQLRPGMSATADIETQTVENVVAVPIQSVTVRAEGGLTTEELQNREDKEAKDKSGNDLGVSSDKDQARRNRDQLQYVVFVKTGGKVRLQKVETGIADNTWIEVKKGVQPGDEVVSGSYAAISRKLKDGMAVHIDEPKKDTGGS